MSIYAWGVSIIGIFFAIFACLCTIISYQKGRYCGVRVYKYAIVASLYACIASFFMTLLVATSSVSIHIGLCFAYALYITTWLFTKIRVRKIANILCSAMNIGIIGSSIVFLLKIHK